MLYVDNETFRARNVEGEAIELHPHFWSIDDGDGNVKLVPISNEDRVIIQAMITYIGDELSRDGRTCNNMAFHHKGVWMTLDKDGKLFVNIHEEFRATFHK